MQALKKLILGKLNFIKSFKNKKSLFHHDPQVRQQMIHDLLLQKKKMHLNEIFQAGLINSIMSHKIQAPYRLMQFYQSSKYIMASFDDEFLSESDREEIHSYVAKQNKNKGQQKSQTKQDEDFSFKHKKNFASMVQGNKQIVCKVVKLYQSFFLFEKSHLKADEIMHIYKKKICQQGLLIPTLFCWLNDWINKQFQSFIKDQIYQISQQKIKKKNRNYRYENMTQALQLTNNLNNDTYEKEKNRQQIKDGFKIYKNRRDDSSQYVRINLNKQKSKQDLYHKISLIKRKSLENRHIQFVMEQSDSQTASSSNNPTFFSTISQQNTTLNPSELERQKRSFTINHFEMSNLLPTKVQQNDTITITESSKKQLFDSDLDSFPINREVLIGAYYDKFYSLYKSLQCVIPDLDIQFVRKIKKNDRKKQIRKRIKEISRIFTRNQTQIKSSVDDFEIKYFQRKKKLQKNHKNKFSRSQPIRHTEDHSQNVQPTFENITNLQSKGEYLAQNSQKRKLNLSLLQKRQYSGQASIQKLYQSRKDEKGKQFLCVNSPIKFELNLPRIPQKQKSMQNRFKETSKMVLIQSGRYKLVDSDRNEQTYFSKRRDNKKNVSLDLDSSNNLNSVVSISVVCTNKNTIMHQYPSILEAISSKNEKNRKVGSKKILNSRLIDKILSQTSADTGEERIDIIQAPKKAHYLLKQSLRKKNQRIQNSLSKLIQQIGINDEPSLTGWEEGQFAPMLS